MTEEFTAVYWMHPLLPDKISFWSSDTGDVIPGTDRVRFPDVVERKARELLNKVSMQDVFYSFGISHPGAIQLQNYPSSLRHPNSALTPVRRSR